MDITNAHIVLTDDKGNDHIIDVNEPDAFMVQHDSTPMITSDLPIGAPQIIRPPRPYQLTITFGWSLLNKVDPLWTVQEP